MLTKVIMSYVECQRCYYNLQLITNHQGPVVRNLVSANRCLRGIKTYRFPWYLTLVSANHASSNPGQETDSFFYNSLKPLKHMLIVRPMVPNIKFKEL